MRGRQRCDEILRLIDEALADAETGPIPHRQPPVTGPRPPVRAT